MFKTCSLVFVALLLVGIFAGCGSSGGGGSTAGVNIQAARFAPRSSTITTGNFIVFRNTDQVDHQVFSGTVDAVSNPVTQSAITINPDNTFTPSALNASFGDTIQWLNLRSFAFVLQILNDAGFVIATLTIQPGQTVSFSNFPYAGQFTYQQQNNVVFTGIVILSGVPHPDNLFTSPVLVPGATFSRQINTPGTFNFFQQNPGATTAFMTGSVTVQ